MGKQDVSIRISLKPAWNAVKEVQLKTRAFMIDHEKNEDLIESTIMCVTELIENAVKYGVENQRCPNIDFDLFADENYLKIAVVNGVDSEKDIAVVTEFINRIKASDDPSSLYTQRLMEMMDNSKPRVSQLGLYRIAFEGGFELDYKYNHGTLTIIARRNI